LQANQETPLGSVLADSVAFPKGHKPHDTLIKHLMDRVHQLDKNLVRPRGNPFKLSGSPLASAQCHGASSTTM
jgi:hypothetical protein